jgi:hypothetical protein
MPLRAWEWASLWFFVYVLAVALAGPGRRAPQRRLAIGLAGAGLALTVLSAVLPHAALLHDWLVPPALLLLSYWSSGALFSAPMPRAERVLMAVDEGLGIPRLAARLGGRAADLLELAYGGIYVLVPLALAAHLAWSPRPDPVRFWTVILVVDFICFGALPWLRTRPPRTLAAGDPWPSGLRRYNRVLVDAASIQVNTCPSGHAAEALAIGLLVLGTPVAPLGFGAAAAVSAGAALGRYHYALDVISGWAVALVVWWLIA